jgi:N utilization substance protein B
VRRSDQRKAAVFALYQHDLTGRDLSGLLGSDASDFTRELAERTLANQEAIDERLSRFTKESWPLSRVAPLERNIMRVAVEEITGEGEVPAEVAVDEAVELAKQFCGADAPKFVNGILGSILRDEQS